MDDQTRLTYFGFFNEIGIIAQLSRAMMEARMEHGLLISHFSVLNHLTRVKDGQTPLALAQAFQVPKTSMTHTLSGLTKHGFVDIRKNPQDGRSKCVWLTEAGHRFREQTIAALDPDIAALYTKLPPEKVAPLIPALAEIRQILDQARDESS